MFSVIFKYFVRGILLSRCWSKFDGIGCQHAPGLVRVGMLGLWSSFAS